MNSVLVADSKKYKQAIISIHKAEWDTAMDEEMRALDENGVWVVVFPPGDSHVLPTKWVFKTKTDADAGIE